MLQKLFTKLKLRGRRQDRTPLQSDQLTAMVQMIAATRADELSCDECFEQLDRFAELTLAGKSAAEALPLVQDHLDRCGDCREEFELLMTALRTETAWHGVRDFPWLAS